jgi:hypothetical protein
MSTYFLYQGFFYIFCMLVYHGICLASLEFLYRHKSFLPSKNTFNNSGLKFLESGSRTDSIKTKKRRNVDHHHRVSPRPINSSSVCFPLGRAIRNFSGTGDGGAANIKINKISRVLQVKNLKYCVRTVDR